MSESLSARQSRTNQPPGSDAVAVPLALARPTTEWHQHIQNRRSDPHIAAQISRGPTGMGEARCRMGAGGVLFVSGHARSPGCFVGVWVWVVSVSGMRKPPGACAPRGFPCNEVRRRATSSHTPVGCSTIAVPGFSLPGSEWGPGVLPGPWPRKSSCTVRRWGLPACGGLGNRTADADMSMFRLVARQCSCRLCRLQEEDAVQPPGLECWCCLRPLVPVGSTLAGLPRPAYRLRVLHGDHRNSKVPRNAYLGAGFPLRCFQRLSLPNVANRRATGVTTGIPEVRPPRSFLYYGQASQHSNERRG